MANVINILNHHMLLTEAGIRIPKGTHAVKILYHDDTDGLGSAKTILEQLKRQGIDQKNIRLLPVSDGTSKDKEEQLLQKKPGQMLIVVDFDRFKNKELANKNIDFHTDHHETEQRFSRGGGATAATEFPSDTEHIGTKYSSQREPDFERGISYVDSADYGDDFETNILQKIDPKKKSGKRLRRLAMLTNTLVGQITRSRRNEEAAELLAKKSKMSIPSFYQTAQEMARLNNLQVKAIKELNKKNPDMKLVDEIRNQVKKEGNQKMANAIQKSNPENLKQMDVPEKLGGKNVGDIERMQKELENPESEKITQKGYVVVQNIQGKGQPGRYANFSLKGDKEINAQLREWATLMQISISPKLPDNVRKQINLVPITRKVLQDVRDEMSNKYEQWAFDIIQKESGGHGGISNVGALGTLGLMPKKLRQELKDLKNSEKYQRMKSLPQSSQKKLKQLPGFKKLEDRIKELENEKQSWKKRRDKIKAEIKKRLIDETNKVIEEAMKNVKESFIDEIVALAEDRY